MLIITVIHKPSCLGVQKLVLKQEAVFFYTNCIMYIIIKPSYYDISVQMYDIAIMYKENSTIFIM